VNQNFPEKMSVFFDTPCIVDFIGICFEELLIFDDESAVGLSEQKLSKRLKIIAFVSR
jgi:hypothetical protein